jgi:TBC1 domain family member 2
VRNEAHDTRSKMSSRGLPGFLRRSLRKHVPEEDEDETEDGGVESNSIGIKKVEELSSDLFTNPILPTMNASVSLHSATTGNTTTTALQLLTNQSENSETTNKNSEVSSNRFVPPLESWYGTAPASKQESQSIRKPYRETQFDKVLTAEVVNVSELRKLSWNGVPGVHRAQVWKLLLGYLPTNAARREQAVTRKRLEYREAIAQHYDIDDDSRTVQEQETLRQVLVDVPRTQPEIPLFRNDRIKRCLARLLYIWAMRHPASSYVQGINDLATPLLVVFLAEYFDSGNETDQNHAINSVLDGHIMNHCSDERLQSVEADVYWCLTNLLAGIQDHYTADQPGLQRMVARLEELVHRIDNDLTRHIRDDTGIQFLQFSFKWMNCLLLREFHLRCVLRLWDTYLSEKDGFEDFHVYVCAAFMCQFSSQLQEMNFDELFGFMQDIPTSDWTDTEIEVLLSQAYVLSTLFKGSDAHLNSSNTL